MRSLYAPLQTRLKSSLTYLAPDAAAPRDVPTPLLFVASKWAAEEPVAQQFAPLLRVLSAHGFGSLLMDVDPSDGVPEAAPNAIAALEQEIVRLLHSPPADVGVAPFPPVLFAAGPMCAVAEAYASSHPLTAMQLLNPPLSMARAAERFPAQFAGSPPVQEFDFEAHFPVRVVWTADEIAWQTERQIPWYVVHRIEHAREDVADESLDRYEWPDMDAGAVDTLHWLELDAGLARGGIDAHARGHGDEDGGGHQIGDDGEEGSRGTPATAGSTYPVPAWFLEGDYAFTTTGSKRMPLRLHEPHLEEQFARGSGKGGQKVNRVANKVLLKHLPTGMRVQSHATRDRTLNRGIARKLLSMKLEVLVKKDWPLGAPKSVLQNKHDRLRRRKRDRMKKQRQTGDAGRAADGKKKGAA
ncbi:hypothetical protein MSPP1_002969 [Malassezia sp. CBS 17886]|nr:hypothetical protein MSPP1_002969 [Malassezia sp. CBS 17886]